MSSATLHSAEAILIEPLSDISDAQSSMIMILSRSHIFSSHSLLYVMAR